MTTMYQDRPLPANIVDPVTAPFFEGARKAVLRLRQCTTCKQPHWYPRPVCPFCMGDTEWIDAKGTGMIYSVSVTRRGVPVPYAIAYVTLDEGVTVLTNIADCDLDTLRIGQRVTVCFKPAAGDGLVAMFTPA